MVFSKPSLVLTALCLLLVAPIHAQSTSSQDTGVTTGGLRIHLDSNGKRVVPDGKASPAAIPPAAENAPAAADSPAAVRSVTSSAAPVGPQVVKSGEGQATVVRLNGMFRAGSRAVIGSDGKLQGDCHIDTNAKGAHK